MRIEPYAHLPIVGRGLYGKVYGDTDFVIKRAENDGTRTYLEWVIQRTLEGRRMRGMPWVEWLQGWGKYHYYVKMRRYEELDAILPADSDAGESDDLLLHEDTPGYVKALLQAFSAETDSYAGDVHGANVMADDNGEWIVTDPSAGNYYPLTLH